MKRSLLLSVNVCTSLLLSSFNVNAQTWNPAGDNISSGSLIIGNNAANSYSRLAIIGPNSPVNIGSRRDVSFEFNSAGKAQVSAYRGGSWDTYLMFSTSGANNAGGTPVPRLFISESGFTGINNTAPSNWLEVTTTSAGEQSSLGIKQVNATSGPNPINQPTTALLYKWYNQPAASINFHRGGDANTGFISFSTELGSALMERMRIDANGNVGIGTSSTGPFMLAVEGAIGARKLKVTSVTPWADFVFDDNYKLPSLSELKAYIHEHKHLPGIPTAEMVKAEGIDVAEMNAKLLQKVEELTLLVIQQGEAIQELKSQLKQP